MRNLRGLRSWGAVGALTLLPGPGDEASLEPLCAVPRRFQVEAGQEISLFLRGGDRTEHLVWPETVPRVFLRGSGCQVNRFDVAPTGADRAELCLAFERPGRLVVGVDFETATLKVDVGELRRRVAESSAQEALREAAARERRTSVPVEVRRAAKVLLAVGDDPTPSATATDKTGQRAEIRLLADPAAARPGDDLPLRVYVQGIGAAEVRVRARAESGATAILRTDADGFTRLRLKSQGVHQLEFDAWSPGEQPGDSWRLYAGSVVFEVPEREAGR